MFCIADVPTEYSNHTMCGSSYNGNCLLLAPTEILCRSPGLVVMGGDSCHEGCGFESQHCMLNGNFSHIYFVKMVMFVYKGRK